ncbi:MAG: universal stress protein [Burkholderiales bacterium]|nr:universal stress protein [Burkholderiales bacterium]
MTYRSILLHIDEGPDVDAQCAYAAGLARQFDARLVGLSCHHLSLALGAPPVFADGDPLTTRMREIEDAALERETIFLRHCRQAGLVAFDAIRDGSPAVAALCSHGLGSDLVVMGAPESAGPRRAAQRALIDAVLLASARPVLVLPRAGRFEPGQGKAVVAWDGSLGAAHAAAAALPLLQRATSVDLVRALPIGAASDMPMPVDITRAVAWLSWHGIAVQVRLAPVDRQVGQALIFDAKAMGAKLLVMGAWGRPRVVERLLGGATREVLSSLGIPTLFAH